MTAGALGGFQRVQLRSLFGARGLDNVGGHVAVPDTPFGGGLGEHQAVGAGGELLSFLTAVALLNYCVAAAPIELAAGLAHEETINTFLDTCTNHGDHIPSLRFKKL